jgi:hypothetical protein
MYTSLFNHGLLHHSCNVWGKLDFILEFCEFFLRVESHLFGQLIEPIDLVIKGSIIQTLHSFHFLNFLMNGRSYFLLDLLVLLFISSDLFSKTRVKRDVWLEWSSFSWHTLEV